MAAPTITALPALPTFPTGPDLPDQPGVFIPQFLLFLTALDPWAGQVNALADYLEGLGGGSSSDAGWAVSESAATTYVVSGVDAAVHKRFTSSSAVELILPLSGHGFTAGDCFRFTQAGAGQVRISPETGTTTVSLSGALSSAGQGAVVELIYAGSNTWDVFGDLVSDLLLLDGDMTDGDDVLLLDGDMTDGDDALSGV